MPSHRTDQDVDARTDRDPDAVKHQKRQSEPALERGSLDDVI
jgi:hypothetical protein